MKKIYLILIIVLGFAISFSLGLFSYKTFFNKTTQTQDTNSNTKTNKEIIEINFNGQTPTYDDMLKKVSDMYNEEIDEDDNSYINVWSNKNFLELINGNSDDLVNTQTREKGLMDFLNSKDSRLADVFATWYTYDSVIPYRTISDNYTIVDMVNKYWKTIIFLGKTTDNNDYDYYIEFFKLDFNNETDFNNAEFSGYVKTTKFIKIIEN